MYFLGDSVARQIAGRMVCEHDRAFQPNLTALDRDRDCAKFSLEDKLKKIERRMLVIGFFVILISVIS